MSDILHLLKIDSSPEAVYRAVAAADGVRSWFSRDADLDSSVGGRGEIRFAGGERILRIQLEALDPAARVVWRVLSAAMPTWPGTEIAFEMRAEEAGTMLRFAHRGFSQADDFFAMSATAWACFLISLKQYLETGRGTPHPEDALSRAAASR